MRESDFNGKEVKNYIMGQTICQLQGNTFIIQALKDEKIPVTVCVIPLDQVKTQQFSLYKDAICQNNSKVFPQQKQLIRTQKNIYMIFEKLKKRTVNGHPGKILQQLLFLFKFESHKINKEQLFLNERDQVKYLPSFFKGGFSVANLYSKFHNKSILIDFFTDLFAPYNKNQLTSFLLEKWQSETVAQEIVKKLNYHQQQPKQNNKSMLKPNYYQQPKIQTSNQVPSLYPSFEDDEKQFQQLMSDVRVNPSLKQQAGDHFRRTSQRVQNQQSKQIKNIIDNVKNSMFEIKKVKESNSKSNSKYQLIQNSSQMEKMQFEAYYKAYMQSFRLLKKTIKSYLKIYRTGFAGVFSAFFLTLVGILRRLKLIRDLQVGIDIFQIGQKGNTHNKQIAQLKGQLKSQAKRLATLKNIIQSSDIPYKTYEILVPYLQDWDEIDPVNLQNFAFFYFSILHRKHFKKDFHAILTIETLYILLNRDYEIVYSQEDCPDHWDEHYYQRRKTLIEVLVPKFKVL